MHIKKCFSTKPPTMPLMFDDKELRQPYILVYSFCSVKLNNIIVVVIIVLLLLLLYSLIESEVVLLYCLFTAKIIVLNIICLV